MTKTGNILLSGHETQDPALAALADCVVLGASGFPCTVGEKLALAFHEAHITCSTATGQLRFSWLELAEVAIAGPGSVTTGGGFIGGGGGLVDALQGMAIASLLNRLTTQTNVHTLLTLVTNFGELHLHHGVMEPAALRIHLAPVFVRLRRLDPAWVQSRGERIDRQLADGAITQEEADTLWGRLLAPPVWKGTPLPPVYAGPEATDWVDAPKGICPNCDKVILLSSERCHYCDANFGEYASWSVLPLA